MLRTHARAAAIAAVWSALAAMPRPAAAQHEHHVVPAGSAQVVLTGTASCAEGTPSSGAVVQLFHGDGPGRHLMATSAGDATGRFAVRTGDRGRVTLRLNDPLRSDRLEFRIADAAFTQQIRRRTARPLLSLFASHAVGGAPREDAPARTEGPARIF